MQVVLNLSDELAALIMGDHVSDLCGSDATLEDRLLFFARAHAQPPPIDQFPDLPF